MTALENRDRPQMPQGYGVGDPQYGFEPIEWSWVADQMSEARSSVAVLTSGSQPAHL